MFCAPSLRGAWLVEFNSLHQGGTENTFLERARYYCSRKEKRLVVFDVRVREVGKEFATVTGAADATRDHMHRFLSHIDAAHVRARIKQ